MRHYRFIAWLWLVLGALATVDKCWHAIHMGPLIYSVAASGGVAWEIGECVFSLAATVAGYGLVRGWAWARVAVELLASVLLGTCGVILLWGDMAFSPVSLAPVIFALYSLVVLLFFRHEPRRV
jgi:hypothetical protein